MIRRFIPWLAALSLLLIGAAHPLTPVSALSPTTIAWADTDIETGSFSQALAPGALQFPRYFGAHPDYQTEWWYYTGNLETEDGRPFGFELTFFRNALKPAATRPVVEDASHWRTNQIYSAHFTLSDIAQQQFYTSERFSRDSIDLAGVIASPYQVWLDDWNVTEVEPGRLRLQAATPEVELDLMLQANRPPILQGDRGLSVKGPQPGQASYYYSMVQQATAGTLRLADRPFTVAGVSWTDHEYSSWAEYLPWINHENSTAISITGWDWFSAQFENGGALMVFLLRRADGSATAASSGTFVAPDGAQTEIAADDFQISVLDARKSPDTQIRYPSRWEISIPKIDLSLEARPLMANQELKTLPATYWEGATRYVGRWRKQPVHGKGYVELTGY